MASFEAPRLLSEKESCTKVLGYCTVPDSDHILVTHDSKVALMQPYNGKLIRSWTCPTSKNHKFTGSAIFSEEDQEFVVIQNKRTLRTIKFRDFDETETFTVKYPIHSIASRPGVAPVVIFEDGSLFYLEEVLEDPKKIQPLKSVPIKIKTIRCVETATLDDGSLLVLMICNDAKDNYKVLAGIKQANKQKVCYFHTPIMKKNQYIISACSIPSRGIPIFSVLWSDQTLTKLSVFVSLQSVNVELDHVTTVKESTAAFRIAPISQDQVLVLSPGTYIECFDMTFGSTLEKLDVAADINQVSVLDDLILLDSPNKIQKIQYAVHPITLAKAIMKSNRSDKLGLPDHVKWKKRQSKKTSLFTAEDKSLIQKLIDTNKTDDFASIWVKVWTKDRSKEFKKELCQSEAMKNIFSKFGLENEKKEFWPCAALKEIISSTFILGCWCQGLISKVLDASDWHMLHNCVLNLKDIPEHIIVQCITKFFTGVTITSESYLPDESAEQEERTVLHCQVPKKISSIMMAIFKLKYTEVVLRAELAAMPFEAAQNFILYLTELLANSSLLSQNPSMNQVIYWLNLVLDSHISEIIMLENCWPMVQQLQDTVDVLGEFFEDLGVVSNLLNRMNCKLPECQKERSLYTVEIMHLGF